MTIRSDGKVVVVGVAESVVAEVIESFRFFVRFGFGSYSEFESDVGDLNADADVGESGRCVSSGLFVLVLIKPFGGPRFL